MKFPNKLRDGAILCAILLLGLALRCYNLPFPSIGYHNMQENEYMGIAHEMDSTHDYSAKRAYFADSAPGRTGLQPPIISYQTLISWKIFGENLWGPRLINAIFGVLSILLIYLISNLLFNDTRLSLFASLSLAIMPLAVFFSRNLQPESPAFFFMLLGSFFYFKFIMKHSGHALILGGLSFSAAWLYKFNFLIGIIPIIFCLPLKPKSSKGRPLAYHAALFILPYSIVAAVIFLLYRAGQLPPVSLNLWGLMDIFSASYWRDHGRTIWWYIKYENFTIVFMLLSLLGIAAASFRRRSSVERYIIGWAFAVIPYLLIFSGPLSQNSYCQMPFLALVCISSAYAISFISDLAKKIVKKDLSIILIIIIIALSAPLARSSIMKMHATVFPGVDVAGESLRGLMEPGKHFFLLTHAQGYGIARYARRYADWSHDIKEFKKKEEDLDIRYLCVYPSDFIISLKKENPGLFEYIRSNYHIKEAGVTEDPRYLFYLILEKGAGPGPINFTEAISGQAQLKTIYRMAGRYVFFYTLRPAQSAHTGK